VTAIAKDGDAPAGAPAGDTISALNTAYVAGNGKVGFVGTLSPSSTRFVWFDTGIKFLSTDALPTTLTGAEGTMGVGNLGEFAYSPSINGEDGIYSQIGTLIRGTDPAPGMPGFFNTFGSRPRMTADGTAYWVGGVTNVSGSSTTQQRLFWKTTTTGGPPVHTPLVKGGDTLAGATLTATGIEFPYSVSDDNSHYINRLTFTGAAATDAGVVLDGTTMVAREGSAIGASTWQGFRFVGVNNAGNWLVYGDDASAADDILVYNGSVISRQGDVLAGTTLGTTIDAAAVNNLNQLIQLWDTSTTTESLFFTGDPNNAAASTIKLLSTNDLLDVNGDTIADYTLTDFNASATITDPIDFGDDGRIFLDVDITPVAGGTALQAIIMIAVPEPGTLGLIGIGALGLFRRRR